MDFDNWIVYLKVLPNVMKEFQYALSQNGLILSIKNLVGFVHQLLQNIKFPGRIKILESPIEVNPIGIASNKKAPLGFTLRGLWSRKGVAYGKTIPWYEKVNR